jgi:phosphatidylserine/phosphatidylglycerophosphate/cardiolipin synthase-like enzyme
MVFTAGGVLASSGADPAAPRITFLRDTRCGGDAGQPQQIAQQLLAFIQGAQKSLHIAIYDFRLSPALGNPIVQALSARAAAGVEVQIAFDHGKPASGGDAFETFGADPAPKGTFDWLQRAFGGTQVQTQAIDAGRQLMHDKYIVRDANTPGATLWTGSTNFTDDAWTFQENNIVQIASPAVCGFYETDFQELWQQGTIDSTGVNDLGTVPGRDTSISLAFAPGEGATIDAHLAALISSAQKRVKVASMVLTSRTILGALADLIEAGHVPVTGIYDATQMAGVVHQWERSASGAGAAQLFQFVAAQLVGKASTPYTDEGVHDFMHNKVVVCDDSVATGSFNFSRNATKNAENSLIIGSTAIAEKYSAYIDDLVAAYRA